MDNLVDVKWKRQNTDRIRKAALTLNDEVETSDDVDEENIADHNMNPEDKHDELERNLKRIRASEQKNLIEERCKEASTSFEAAKEKLLDAINNIAKVDEDTNATVDSLSGASDRAKEAKNDLGMMNKLYCGLDSTSPHSYGLRTKMLDVLERNDQELSAITASINDKLNALRAFNEKYHAVTRKFDLIKDDASKAADLLRMDELRTELEKLKFNAETLPSIAEEIYGVLEPAKKAREVIEALMKVKEMLESKIAAAVEKDSTKKFLI